MENTHLIALAEIREKLEGKAGSIEDIFLLAVREAKKSPWVRGDEDLFRIAVGALLSHYGPGSPEWDRITEEWKMIQRIDLIMRSAHLELSISSLEEPPNFEPIGLLEIWRKG